MEIQHSDHRKCDLYSFLFNLADCTFLKRSYNFIKSKIDSLFFLFMELSIPRDLQQ